MIAAAVAAIRAGEVVGVPTDTVYGIGADPLNEAAVGRLYELKGRPANKPIGLLVATVGQAREIGQISDAAAELADLHWPGALTLIVTPRVVLANWVGDRQSDTVGIRVPDHEITRELLIRAGPLAVTSANLSGGEEARNDRQAREIFGEGVAVYLEGECPGGEASTVVDATGSELTLIREGPIVI